MARYPAPFSSPLITGPTFGFYFLRQSSARLIEHIERATKLLAERDAEVDRLRAMGACVS